MQSCCCTWIKDWILFFFFFLKKRKKRTGEALRTVLNYMKKVLVLVIITPSLERWKGSCVCVRWDSQWCCTEAEGHTSKGWFGILSAKDQAFKVPLVLDNASGYPEGLSLTYLNIHAAYLSNTTTSLPQSQDQGAVAVFKSTRHSTLNADEDTQVSVTECKKLYSTVA